MGYRWKPSKAMKAAYHQRMLAIEQAKNETPDGYPIECTGDCCRGDEIAFFNAGKTEGRLFGTIVSESYGAAKQQHTFTIELEDGSKMLIKGRNLYCSGVYRKAWAKGEGERRRVLNEKHERGDEARSERLERKSRSYSPFGEWPEPDIDY